MRNRIFHTPFRKPSNIFILAILLGLMGCNLPGRLAAATPTQEPSPTSMPTVDTPSPLPPTPTITISPTPMPTATPSPINIVFAAGTTAAVEQGSIQPNQIQNFSLSAMQYQPMILALESSSNDAYLAVYEPDGNALLDPAIHKWTNWQWLLPKTEIYTIQVIGGATASNYTLTAKVAARATFPAGANSITLSGSTLKGFVVSYAIACKTGQTMTASLNVPASSAYLDVFGIATGTLLSPLSKANTWTGTLPSTEDYIIEVIPNNGQVINYSLTVVVQ